MILSWNFFQCAFTNLKFICAIVFFLVLLGTHNAFFSLCAFTISLLYIIFQKENHEFKLMMFLLPLASIFKLSAESSSFYTLLLLFCSVKYLIENFLLSEKLFIYFFFIFFEQIVYGSIAFSTTIKFCSGLIFTFYGLNRLNERQSISCFGAFCFSFFLSTICFFLLSDSDFFKIKQFCQTAILGGSYGIDAIFQFSGMYNDPNFFAVNLIIALILSVVLYQKKVIIFPILIVVFFVFGYFAVITYSKSCFLMFFFPVFLVFYYCVTVKKKGAFLFFFLIMLFFLAFGGSRETSFLDIVLQRFSSANSLNELTTGRTDIWISYFDFFENNIGSFFYGCSFSAPLVNNAEAHNIYIEILYTSGIIGFFLFIWMIKDLLDSNNFFCKKKLLFNYSIFICMIVMYFFLSGLFMYDFTCHLLLAGLVYKIDFTEDLLHNKIFLR